MPDYTVLTPFPHAGRTAQPGESVSLTDRQALYLHLAGRIKPAPDPAAPGPTDNPKRRRAK